MADIALSALPQGTTLETNATIIVVQTVGSTVVNQRIPKALFFSQSLASSLVATNNLSDLIDAAAARLNIGVHNLIYLSGTAAPTTALGNLGDFAFNDNFEWYELTAITPAVVWTLRANGVTATELTTAITTHSSATDPHPIYLTQAEAAVLYAPLGESPGSGARYNFNTSTAFSSITTGQILFNNAASASVTSIAIHEMDRNNGPMGSVLDLIAIGSKLQISFDTNEELYAWFNVTAIVDNGAYRTYTVTALASSGTPVNAEVVLGIYGAAATASTTGGATGVQFTYINTAGTPTNGQVRSADITYIGLSTVSISTTDAQTKSVADVLAKLKTGAIVEFAKDSANRVRGTIAADYASGTNSFDWSGQVVYGAITNNSTVYLSIISDAPTVSSEISSGASLMWQTVTAATNLAVNNGYLLNVANLEHTLPTGVLGDEVLLIGTNNWSAKTQNGLVYLSSGSNNTGIKSAAGFPRAVALLRCLSGANWMAAQSEGLELYAYSTSGPGAAITETYRVAILAQGYTMLAGEITALTSLINALSTAGLWDATGVVFGLYPLLGTTRAQQRINVVSPGTGDLSNIDGTLTHNATGFTGNGSIYAGSTFMNTHWTTSNFRAFFGAFSGVPSGTASPIYGVELFRNCYLTGAGTNGVSLGIHTGNNEVTPTAITFPFSGRVGAISRVSAANVVDRPYINGVAQIDSVAAARDTSTNQTDLRMLRCNSVNPPSGATCRGFMVLKSAAGLSDANATSIDTAFGAFLTAIGR